MWYEVDLDNLACWGLQCQSKFVFRDKNQGRNNPQQPLLSCSVSLSSRPHDVRVGPLKGHPARIEAQHSHNTRGQLLHALQSHENRLPQSGHLAELSHAPRPRPLTITRDKMAERGGQELSLGRDFEQRPLTISEHHERGGHSARFSPYQTQERGGGGLPENKVFVANLSYSVTWQALKTHMKKGLTQKYTLVPLDA